MLFDNTLKVLHSGLNARMERQAVVSSNVANVDTPGYKARTLHFEESLKKATGRSSEAKLAVTDGSHYSFAGAQGSASTMTEVSDTPGRTDGNNVDLEREMATLAANGTEYRALSLLARKKLGLVRYAVMNS